MPHWDDEYLVPYLSTGHIQSLSGITKAKRPKVNIGFQHPGNEFPAKPKPRAKPKPKPRPATRRRTR